MYQWVNSERTTIRRLSDGACIPANEGNRDYREALAWSRQEGNAFADADPAPAEQPSLEEIVVGQIAKMATDLNVGLTPDFDRVRRAMEDKALRRAQRGN
jgi:hypothetical protein